MPSFQIQEVISQRSYEDKYGAKISYKVKFSGDQGNGEAEISQKPETAAPSPGQTIDATLEQTQWGYKLKKAPPANRGNGSGPRVEDPKKSAEIRRMASQKVAVELLGIEVQIALAQNDERGFLKKLGEADDGVSRALRKRIEWFEQNTEQAGEKAS